MASLFNAWRKALSNYKPRKIRGVFWYRAVIPSRQRTMLNMDGALIFGGVTMRQGNLELSIYPGQKRVVLPGSPAELSHRVIT